MTKLLTTTAVILAVFAAMPAQAATSGKGLKKDPTRTSLVRVALAKKAKDLLRPPNKELRIKAATSSKRVSIIEKEGAPAALVRERALTR